MQEAVWARKHPVAYLNELASALTNQSNIYAELRQGTDALDANREAIEIRRDLNRGDLSAFSADLALSPERLTGEDIVTRGTCCYRNSSGRRRQNGRPRGLPPEVSGAGLLVGAKLGREHPSAVPSRLRVG